MRGRFDLFQVDGFADSDFGTPLVPNPVFRAIVPAWSRSVYRSGGSRVWSGLW
jgi:hypothetical protein